MNKLFNKKLIMVSIFIVIMVSGAAAQADCIDFSVALPGQTYVISSGSAIDKMTLTFGESTAIGYCPSGEALLEWENCIVENKIEYCAMQSLPLRYQTQSGSPWILIPDFALAWLMDSKLYIIPLNTPMLTLESSTSAAPIPWGNW